MSRLTSELKPQDSQLFHHFVIIVNFRPDNIQFGQDQARYYSDYFRIFRVLKYVVQTIQEAYCSCICLTLYHYISNIMTTSECSKYLFWIYINKLLIYFTKKGNNDKIITALIMYRIILITRWSTDFCVSDLQVYFKV